MGTRVWTSAWLPYNLAARAVTFLSFYSFFQGRWEEGAWSLKNQTTATIRCLLDRKNIWWWTGNSVSKEKVKGNIYIYFCFY